MCKPNRRCIRRSYCQGHVPNSSFFDQGRNPPAPNPNSGDCAGRLGGSDGLWRLPQLYHLESDSSMQKTLKTSAPVNPNPNPRPGALFFVLAAKNWLHFRIGKNTQNVVIKERKKKKEKKKKRRFGRNWPSARREEKMSELCHMSYESDVR